MIQKRTDGKKTIGIKFDPIVKEYALKDKYVKTGDGEDDFIITKVPYVTDEYNQVEVLKARCEGCELKTILSRLQAGEILDSGRSPQYVDATQMPQTMAEALELKKKTEEVIEASGIKGLSKEDLKKFGDVLKMTPEQVSSLVRKLQADRIKAGDKTGAKSGVEVKPDVKTGVEPVEEK